MKFSANDVSKTAKLLFGIEDMPVTLITKPYKMFAKVTVRLCALFSFLIFLSFAPLITAFLFAFYIMLFYFTNIFINLCVKFGYKKILMIIIFGVLYFLCFIVTTNLRHFAADLYFN